MREQMPFDFRVSLDIAVVIEVIMAEVCKRRRAECEPRQAILIQGVRGCFQRYETDVFRA